MTTKSFGMAPFVVLLLCLTTQAEQVRGVIRKIDPEKKELVIEARGLRVRGVPMTFQVGSEAHILLGKEAAGLSDLQPGDRVVVSYEQRAGVMVVQGISVRGLIKTAPSTAPGEEKVTGTLTRLDREGREIVVIGPVPGEEGDVETTLTVPDHVRIRRDQMEISWKDLKEGEKVTIGTEKKGEKLAAVDIQAGTPAPAPNKTDLRAEHIHQAMDLTQMLLQKLQEKREQERRQPVGPNPPP